MIHFLSKQKTNVYANKVCLLRLDLNISKTDLLSSPRITRIKETIRLLKKANCTIVILSHKGRPKDDGICVPYKNHASIRRFSKKALSNYSLKPVARVLEKSIKCKVQFKDSFDFKELVADIYQAPLGSVFLLENLRFIAEEESNDRGFAQDLALLGDLFVNDAFAVSHRKNASVHALADQLPSYAGLELEQEIHALSTVLQKPKKPVVLIVGGVKVSDKAGVLTSLGARLDYVLCGGGVANTFFSQANIPVGKSVYEKDFSLAPVVRKVKGSIIIPDDVVVSQNKILDIGLKTQQEYERIIARAGTIIWNGPMGNIEDARYTKGTDAIITYIAKSKAFSLVGGGETTAYIYKKKCQHKFSFVSIGGGALLEYLAKGTLPGIAVLDRQ